MIDLLTQPPDYLFADAVYAAYLHAARHMSGWERTLDDLAADRPPPQAPERPPVDGPFPPGVTWHNTIHLQVYAYCGREKIMLACIRSPDITPDSIARAGRMAAAARAVRDQGPAAMRAAAREVV